MSDSTETICFTCGMPTGQEPDQFPRLNALPSGQPCPTCRDRLLECLPGILPGQLHGDQGQPLDAEGEVSLSEGLPRSIHWGDDDWTDEPDEPA